MQERYPYLCNPLSRMSRFGIACGKTNQQPMDLETWISIHIILWGIKWQHFMTYMLSAVWGKLKSLSENFSIVLGWVVHFYATSRDAEPHRVSQTSPDITQASWMLIFFKLLVNPDNGQVLSSMGGWFDKLILC